MTTWSKAIKICGGEDEILECTLTKEELNEEFNDGYRDDNGHPFTKEAPEQ